MSSEATGGGGGSSVPFAATLPPGCDGWQAIAVGMAPAATPSASILQPWVQSLTLRYQGTLMGAMRGCDGVPKEDPSKALIRLVRVLCLQPFDVRELKTPNGYMTITADNLEEAFDALLDSFDQYPIHFFAHLMFALEIIGYHHPDEMQACWCRNAYQQMATALHLHPETYVQLAARMNEDRVARRALNVEQVQAACSCLVRIHANWRNGHDQKGAPKTPDSSCWYVVRPVAGTRVQEMYLDECCTWSKYFSCAVLFDTEQEAIDLIQRYPLAFARQGILVKMFLASPIK